MALSRFAGTANKRDPYRNFNFRILLGGVAVAACRKISGLTASVEVVKFRAGNSRSSVDETLPGRVMYEPITIEAGVTADDAFKAWVGELIHHESSDGARAADPNFRRTVEIEVYDIDNVNPVKKYEIYNCWPSKYSVSEMDGSANEVLIETLEFQHEGFSEFQLEQ